MPAALAAPPAQQAAIRFQAEDKCVAASIVGHPDRDAVSLHMRDLDVDACLIRHDLPPRAHVAPPGDYAEADAAAKAAADPARPADAPALQPFCIGKRAC